MPRQIINADVDFADNTPGAGKTSQRLNDYEEGVWTPAITFGGLGVDITYGSVSGYYTKVGNLVTLSAYISLTSKGSSVGAAVIAGLPFTVANNNAAYAAAAIRFIRIDFADQYSAAVIPNTDTLELYETAADGTASAITDVDFADNSGIMLSVTYRAE